VAFESGRSARARAERFTHTRAALTRCGRRHSIIKCGARPARNSPLALPTDSSDGPLGPLNDNPLEYFTKIACAYGDIAGLRILNFKTIFINHPDLIEEVLVTNARKYSKGRVLRANRHVFGEGLLTSEGDFWLRQRRLAQPAFHRVRIASYAGTMVEYTQRMLDGWRGGEERDAHQEMMRLTLQIVGKTLFDADVERDAQEVGKSLELLLEIGANFRRTIFVPHWLPTPANLRVKREVAQIEKILYRIIGERRASGRDAGDLLSMLLSAQDEDGSRMTDRQLRDEAITLFLAGHETTASTLSWTWWLLAQNPAVEAKLHAELDAVLGDRAPSLEDPAKTRLHGTGHHGIAAAVSGSVGNGEAGPSRTMKLRVTQ